MKYKLKWELPHDAVTCLGWLLSARGVEDIEGYVYPSKDYQSTMVDARIVLKNLVLPANTSSRTC
mgnify:CR=1 FL=1